MTRQEILSAIRPYFDIDELVCDHVLAKWGEKAWQFLDTDYLHCLLVIRRDIIRMPMYCNSRNSHQKGLRCNLCQLVREKRIPYLSAHVLGKAGDFTCPYMSAENMRQKIIANASMLPCPIRIESGVSWLHFDVLQQYNITDKVYVFRA